MSQPQHPETRKLNAMWYPDEFPEQKKDNGFQTGEICIMCGLWLILSDVFISCDKYTVMM